MDTILSDVVPGRQRETDTLETDTARNVCLGRKPHRCGDVFNVWVKKEKKKSFPLICF